MLKIKNGKLYGTHLSFALPENFYLALKRDICEGNGLQFISEDGAVEIEILFERGTENLREELLTFGEDCNFSLKGEIVPVFRGRKGMAALFVNQAKTEKYYEERYLVPENKNGENMICIGISLLHWRGGKFRSLNEVLNAREVSDFLNSIHLR
mgnify:CR=1 FL=1